VWIVPGRSSTTRRPPPGRLRDSFPLGSAVTVRRGQRLELASKPNWAQFVPALAKVDVIRGAATGRSSDRDSFHTPDTSVVQAYDVSGQGPSFTITYALGKVDQPCYVRLRGSDGKRLAVGINGAGVDPSGPAADVMGQADPWDDLWFYTNPIWVLPE
jgi:hypothetical protein